MCNCDQKASSAGRISGDNGFQAAMAEKAAYQEKMAINSIRSSTDVLMSMMGMLNQQINHELRSLRQIEETVDQLIKESPEGETSKLDPLFKMIDSGRAKVDTLVGVRQEIEFLAAGYDGAPHHPRGLEGLQGISIMNIDSLFADMAKAEAKGESQPDAPKAE